MENSGTVLNRLQCLGLIRLIRCTKKGRDWIFLDDFSAKKRAKKCPQV